MINSDQVHATIFHLHALSVLDIPGSYFNCLVDLSVAGRELFKCLFRCTEASSQPPQGASEAAPRNHEAAALDVVSLHCLSESNPLDICTAAEAVRAAA